MTMAMLDSHVHDTQPSSQLRSVRHGFSTAGGRFVGQSAASDAMVRGLASAASSRHPVLFVGSRGTGKSFFARMLHETTAVGTKPFVVLGNADAPLDVATLHRCHAAASGGTLFVAAIDRLAPELQDALLALATAGSAADDPRLVASTEKPLEEEVAAGRFRAEILALFASATIRVPSLDERAEDIRPFVKHFFGIASARARRADLRGVSPEASSMLEAHSFADNLRGLERAIEQAVAFAEGPYVTVSDLPEEIRVPQDIASPLLVGSLPAQGFDLRAAVEEFETRMILQALERTGWNKNRASRLLGLNRTTLVEMIKRKRLVPPTGARRSPSLVKESVHLRDADEPQHFTADAE
jgi:DNA-binding NtrC family response regulator